MVNSLDYSLISSNKEGEHVSMCENVEKPIQNAGKMIRTSRPRNEQEINPYKRWRR